MTHQYLSNVYCVQGGMLLGKKDSFCIFLLDCKKSSILSSERVFSCSVCGLTVRTLCGSATLKARAQGAAAQSSGEKLSSAL